MHYCDHNATSPFRPESRDAMRACAGRRRQSVVGACQRPGGARHCGKGARMGGSARRMPSADQVIFTSGGTEANALALWGAVEAR